MLNLNMRPTLNHLSLKDLGKDHGSLEKYSDHSKQEANRGPLEHEVSIISPHSSDLLVV
uniref:Uncharacterized protein n=1 Tax=Arion vulgaris TaxID=1028688 RepID=A0A0B7AFR4_9EUPU